MIVRLTPACSLALRSSRGVLQPERWGSYAAARYVSCVGDVVELVPGPPTSTVRVPARWSYRLRAWPRRPRV